MGEEKPEEELMGKRKPSPRLMQQDLVAISIMTKLFLVIHSLKRKK